MTIQGNIETYEISQSDCFWNMLCRLDSNQIKLDIDDIQNTPGVYIFWSWDDIPIRIGKGIKVRNRIISYYTNQMNWYVFEDMQNEIQYVSVIYCVNELETRNIEDDLLHKYKPKYNYRDLK